MPWANSFSPPVSARRTAVRRLTVMYSAITVPKSSIMGLMSDS